MKLACPGGLRKTPMVVGLELGQRNGFLPHVSYKKKTLTQKRLYQISPNWCTVDFEFVTLPTQFGLGFYKWFLMLIVYNVCFNLLSLCPYAQVLIPSSGIFLLLSKHDE